MFKIILIILLSISSLSVIAAEKQFFKIPYVVEDKSTLQQILSSFAYSDRHISPQHRAYNRTVKENSQISDWNALMKGTPLDLFIDINDLDRAKYDAYLANTQVASISSTPSLAPSGFKGSVFYMASYGRFTQSSEKADIEFYQNSPISIGTAWSYYPQGSRWSFSSSVYGSYLIASGSNLNDKDVQVPPELGANLYPEYRFNDWNFTGYFGLDYERFSTFNMGTIQNERKIVVDQNTVLYLTFGFSRLFQAPGGPYFTKVSLSKSLTTTTSTDSNYPENEDYDGYKAMWYLNKKISSKYFIHSLLKYHWMSGPSDLTTLRLGVGLGYILH